MATRSSAAAAALQDVQRIHGHKVAHGCSGPPGCPESLWPRGRPWLPRASRMSREFMATRSSMAALGLPDARGEFMATRSSMAAAGLQDVQRDHGHKVVRGCCGPAGCPWRVHGHEAVAAAGLQDVQSVHGLQDVRRVHGREDVHGCCGPPECPRSAQLDRIVDQNPPDHEISAW